MFRSFIAPTRNQRCRELLLVRALEREDHSELKIHAALLRYVTIEDGPYEWMGLSPVTEQGGFGFQPGGTAPISDIYLTGDKNQGIGSVLFSLAVAWLKEYHGGAILTRFQCTRSAVPFYERFGFSLEAGAAEYIAQQSIDQLREQTLNKWRNWDWPVGQSEREAFDREFPIRGQSAESMLSNAN